MLTRVELAARDELGLWRASLSLNGSPWVEDPTYPFAFELRGLPEGSFRVRARVEDFAGNLAEREMVIHVGDPEAAETWPTPPEGSIAPYLEDSSGSPLVCESSDECGPGARCLEGVCLVDLEGGCRTGGPAPRDLPRLWFWLVCLAPRPRRFGLSSRPPDC